MAAQEGQLACVQHLIEEGELELKNIKTALERSEQKGHTEIIDYLNHHLNTTTLFLPYASRKTLQKEMVAAYEACPAAEREHYCPPQFNSEV